MATILVGTIKGCQVIKGNGEVKTELPDRVVGALTRNADSCLAVVDGKEIWRRDANEEWSEVTKVDDFLVSIVPVNGSIFAGTMGGARLWSLSPKREAEQVNGFDSVEGRSQWFGEGPPLHVRGLTATADGQTVLAAVHVGGIPRSANKGDSWAPTVPINYDVHEVRAHRKLPNIVAAASALGLCLSGDGGQNWRLIKDGLELTDSLAVAVLNDEILFSIQDGPFAKQSQIFRCSIGGEHLEQVRDGLPEYLEGKVDTNHISANDKQAAVLDHGGNLWLAESGSRDWKCIAKVSHPGDGLLLV